MWVAMAIGHVAIAVRTATLARCLKWDLIYEAAGQRWPRRLSSTALARSVGDGLGHGQRRDHILSSWPTRLLDERPFV